MGNYKLKLSDMIPNSWLYKLKSNHGFRRSKLVENEPQKSPQTPRIMPNRASCYYSLRGEPPEHCSVHRRRAPETHFPTNTTKKTKKKTRRTGARSPRLAGSPVYSTCSYRGWADQEDSASQASVAALEIGRNATSCTSGEREIESFDVASEIGLPPILTRTTKKEVAKEETISVESRALGKTGIRCPSSPGLNRLRMRANTPRIRRGVRVQCRNRSCAQQLPIQHKPGREGRGVGDSFAVVKASSDPRRDFRESMIEMINENDIRTSSALEELLACYLTLNADEYHDVIVKVFEQIWLELTNVT